MDGTLEDRDLAMVESELMRLDVAFERLGGTSLALQVRLQRVESTGHDREVVQEKVREVPVLLAVQARGRTSRVRS